MQIAVQYARGGLPPCARRRVHDYIAAHLNQKITNDALAQIAGLSTSHFYTVFKQTEGMSPHRYVLQYRVRRIQQLLTSTEMSLAEIADAVGFSNQSHCIQSFRKIVGVTPCDYRRCCLQGSGHRRNTPSRTNLSPTERTNSLIFEIIKLGGERAVSSLTNRRISLSNKSSSTL